MTASPTLKIFLSLLFAFFLIAPKPADGDDKALRVIALTDFHGALEPQVLFTANQESVEVGGAALLSSYIQILKSIDDTPTIIIDGGDLFQGSLVSNSAEGRPVIDFYNYMGVDAAAIGNHDFDYGPVGPQATPKNSFDNPRGALEERIKQANFPLLGVNIKQIDPEGSWAKGSVILQKGNVSVGVIGFASPETPETTNRKNLVGLKFLDPVKPILDEAHHLRNAGVDYIILVGHAGGACSDNSAEKWTSLVGCENSELFSILKKLPKGTIDMAVGGHTHQGIAKNFTGIPVLQAFSNSHHLGWLTLTKNGNTTQSTVGTLTEICGSGIMVGDHLSCNATSLKDATSPVQNASFLQQPITPDPAVMSLLKPDFNRVQELKDEPLGLNTLGDFNRDYFGENAVGNLLADFLVGAVKDTDIVLLNNGGLRADLTVKPLTYNDIFNIFPFDNLLAIMEVNGETLLKMMEMGISNQSGGISWSGLSFSADHCKVIEANVNGVPLEKTRIYKIVTSDFIAGGGSHFDRLNIKPEQITILDDQPNMREQAIAALKRHNRALDPLDYFNPQKPRQNIKTRCRN